MSTNIEITSEQKQNGVYVVQFKTKMLAIFTYYIESQGQAYLIDPTYDNKAYTDFITKRGATLKYVVLTHYHADFIAGHTEFKVPVLMGPGSKRQFNNFELIEIPENGKFKVGKVETRVISTPGHTMESACFILGDQNRKQFCIFTGDTVFLRQVGRPDLAVDLEVSLRDLAGFLYDSIQKIKQLDGSLRLYPGHGSGSACGKSIGSGNFCNLKIQSEQNYAFLIKDKDEFIEKITKDLPAPPKYFFYDAKVNQQGTSALYQKVFKEAKKPLSVQQFENLIKDGVPIIDTRNIAEGGLIKGSYWLAMKGMICQLISQLLQPTMPFALVTEAGKQEQVIERLLRIGYCNIRGYCNFEIKNWKGQLLKPEIKAYEELNTAKSVFIDVRNKQEWQESGVLEHALLISLPQLKAKLDFVHEFVNKHPEAEIVINCKTGVRARVAASILCQSLNNRKVCVLNEPFDKIQEKGAKLTPYKEP